jgi:hypothetical protein
MATEAQTSANRSNSQKSTGPRTPEGKAKVAQNAVKHGLLARSAVLQGEDWEEYTCFSENLLDELYPDGMVEQELASRIVDLSWRLRRATRNQSPVFAALYDQHAADPEAPFGPEACPDPEPGALPEDAPNLGWMLMKDFAGERVLERMLMYERRIEHSLYRTMAELEKRQRRRHEAYAQAKTAAERWEPGKEGPDWRSRGSGEPRRAWVPGGPNLLSETPGSAVSPFSQGVRTNGPEAGAAQAVEIPHPSTIPSFQDSNPRPQAQGQACGTKPISLNHGQDAHATLAPDGVTTNLAAAQGQACETKPICAGGNDRPRGYTPIFRRRR